MATEISVNINKSITLALCEPKEESHVIVTKGKTIRKGKVAR